MQGRPDREIGLQALGPGTSHSRRTVLRWLAAAVGGTALGGCAQTANGPRPPAEETVELVYQDWRTDWFPPMAQEMLEQFYADHPHIRVYYTPDPENFQEQMLAEMQAGTAADVFQGCCTHFPAWAQMGYALDLNPYVEADLDQATLDDWDPAQVRALRTHAGLQFGLPKYHGALALYYNKDVFDSCGVIYPNSTWDHAAYADAMVRLSRDRDHDGHPDLWGSLFDIGWDRIQVHVNGWGGHFVDPEDPAHSLMCEPEALAALAWLRARMWEDHVMATPFDVRYISTRQAFVTGRVAMVEDGSWALKDILTGADFRVGIAPFPAGPVRRVTLATSDGFGIFAGTRHPDAAWELVRFLVGQDYGRAMARANLLQPARASLIDEWTRFVREQFPERSAGVDVAAFAEGHVQGYSVTTEVFATMAQATQIAEAAWEQILALGSAPVAHMEEACRLIQAAQPVGG